MGNKKTILYARQLRRRNSSPFEGWVHTDELLSNADIDYVVRNFNPGRALITGLLNVASACTESAEHNIRHNMPTASSMDETIAPTFKTTKEVDADGYALMFGAVANECGKTIPPNHLTKLSKAIEKNIDRLYPNSNMLPMIAKMGGKILVTVNGHPVVVALGTTFFMMCDSSMCSCFIEDVNFESLFKRFLANLSTTPKSGKETFNDDITIGLDPELEGYFIDKDGPDFDSQCIASAHIRNGDGRVGCDGHSDIFEFRPTHSKNADIVVKNIQKCYDILGYTLAGLEKDVYLFSGGGILDPIGGHIHIGGTYFQNISNEDTAGFFGALMDDFIYWPIRDTMPGGLRSWGNHPDCKRSNREHRKAGFVDKRPSYVFQQIKGAKTYSRSSTYCPSYEAPNSFRFTGYGFEYRSLPSFIVSPDFAEIILKMAITIARFSLDCYNKSVDFSYNVPPKTEDYLKLFPSQLYKRFMRYINGDLNDIFLTNALSNWGVDTKSWEPVIKLSGESTTLKTGIDITRKVQPVIKQLSAEYPVISKIRSIKVHMERDNFDLSHYAIRTDRAIYADPEDVNFLRNRKHTSSTSDRNIGVTVYQDSDTMGFYTSITEAIALALTARVGFKHFNSFVSLLSKALPNPEVKVNSKRVLIKLQGKAASNHAQTSFNPEQLGEMLERIDRGQLDCTTEITDGCNCLTCTALRQFRRDMCYDCDNVDCELSEVNRNEED